MKKTPGNHTPEKTHLYVLEYERVCFADTCYKIGISNDPTRRRREHEQKLHGFVRTISFNVWQFNDPAVGGTVENIMTILYMANVGFDRVRGSCYDYADQSGLLYVRDDGTWKLDSSSRRRKVIESAHHAVATCTNVCYNCHGPHLRNRCPSSKPHKHHRYFRENGTALTSPVNIEAFISPFMKCYGKKVVGTFKARSEERVSRAMRKSDGVKPLRYNLRSRRVYTPNGVKRPRHCSVRSRVSAKAATKKQVNRRYNLRPRPKGKST